MAGASIEVEGTSFSQRAYLVSISCAAVVFVWWIGQAIYNVYFHPLSKYPGPKLWAASDLPRYYYEATGVLDHKIVSFHEKYGHWVRYMPNAVSTTDSAAYKDVVGFGKSHLVKDPAIHDVVVKGAKDIGIIQSNNVNHARMRKQLAHAFSDRALREQEGILQGYVDTLIGQLRDAAGTGAKVDIMHKYMYTTSDITSELAFGASFNSLVDDKMRPYVHIQDSMGPFMSSARLIARFPIMTPLIAFSLRSALTMMRTNRKWVHEVLTKRLAQGVMEDKKDFLSYILKHKDSDAAMTDGEITETSRTLILAGAETTRTVLSYVTYSLLKNPGTLQKAQEEVRAAFASEAEINYLGVSAKLPYMLACLDEAMRIHPPVASTAMARKSPADEPVIVVGKVIPPNTVVTVHPLSAHLTSHNWTDPLSFRPDRWTGTDPKFASDDRSASQPFSIGPRSCIGKNLAYAKMRLILARVLWNFDLELCPESESWGDQKIIMFWIGGPLWVRLHPRK